MPIFHTRVYYEDTDAAGVVYYANYLKYAERARTEAVRAAGIHQQQLLEGEGVGFVVKSAQVDYFKPARLDDALCVHTTLQQNTAASISLLQTICRGEEKLVSIRVQLVVVNANFAPMRLREPLKTKLLQAFEG